MDNHAQETPLYQQNNNLTFNDQNCILGQTPNFGGQDINNGQKCIFKQVLDDQVQNNEGVPAKKRRGRKPRQIDPSL